MRFNRKAMIGFPMRLTIAFLILAIFLPVMNVMISDMEDDSTAMEASKEADKLMDAASTTYYAGIGGYHTVELEIPSECHIRIGGNGPDSYSIGVFLNDSEVDRKYMQRPSVHILGEEMNIRGNVTLSVSCVMIDGEYGIEVSIID